MLVICFGPPYFKTKGKIWDRASTFVSPSGGCVVVLGGSKTTEGASLFVSPPARAKPDTGPRSGLCFSLVVGVVVAVVVVEFSLN